MATELGIKELRSLTSGRIREMAPDEEIVVTDRGEAIATIRPIRAMSDKERFLADLRELPAGDSGAMEDLMEMKQNSIDNQRIRD